MHLSPRDVDKLVTVHPLVVAEGGGGREVLARANTIGPRETFGVVPYTGG